MLQISRTRPIPAKGVLKAINAYGMDLLLFVDGLGRIRSASHSVERTTERPCVSLAGLQMEDLVRTADRGKLTRALERSANDVEILLNLIHANGSELPYTAMVMDHCKDPEIGCYVIVLRQAVESDPTQHLALVSVERSRLTSLAQNSAKLRSTMASIADGFFSLDREWRFLNCDKTTSGFANMPSADLIGRSFQEVFPVEDEHPLLDLLNSVVDGKRYARADIFSRLHNTWLDVWVFADPKGISVYHTDIGERKQKQTDLMLANERYRLATQLTEEAHWDWDLLTNEIGWGEGFRIQFGFQMVKSDLQGWFDIVHPDDQERVTASLQLVIDDPGILVWEDRYRIIKPDGSHALVHDRGSVIRDKNQCALRMVGSLRDISEEHEAASQKDLLHEVTLALAASPDVGSGMEEMLSILCRYTGYVIGEIWLLDEFERNMMPCGHHVEKSELSLFPELMQGHRIFPGEGLPGTAWKEDKFLHWPDLQENASFIRQEAARDLGITEGLAFPVRYGEQVIAMITLFSDRPMCFHEGDLELLDAIAMHIAPEVKKRRAEKDLHNFFTLTKDLLFIMDPEGRIYKHNPAFSTELGYDVKDLWGTHFLEHVHPDDVQRTLDARNTINKDQNVSYLENRIRCADGTYRWIAWTTTYADKDGIIYCTGKDITEKKQDESSLFEVTQRLFDFKESITDALFMLDPDQKFTYVNHEGQKLLRHSYGELMGQPFWDMFPEAAGSEFELQFLEAERTGKAVHFETYFPPLASWYEVHAYPSLIGLSVFFKDISQAHVLGSFLKLERKALAENMSRSEPLSKILDTLLLGVEKLIPGMYSAVLKVDPSGKTLSPKAAPSLPDLYLEMTRNFPIKEGEGSLSTAAARKSIVIVKDILTDPLWEKYRAAAKPFGLRACWTYPVISSSGRLLAVVALYFGEPREPGTIEQLLAERLTHTITVLIESHRTEEAIRVSNERYGLISKATNDATWDWDVNTNAFIWGERVTDLFGIDPETENSDLISWSSRVYPDDKEEVLQSIHEVLMDKKASKWEKEYRFIRADGSIAHVLDRGYVIRDKNGGALRVVGAMQDMTDRKEKELALHELNDQFAQRTRDLEISNAELERFAYMVSHDLQEPLRMISSFLQLLEKKYGPQLDDKAREYITFAVNGSERMKRLIRDLLEYSRVSINRENFSEVDMTALALQMQNMFMQEIETTGAVIECEDLPAITANRTHMLQLLQNLVGNALKYRSEHPPRIKLAALPREGHWEFQVSDNGIGVDERHFEKIFIIFQRLHHDKEQSGTGIGLAICKKIVEKHQGRIWITSAPGQGSTIHFTIAMEPGPAH